MKQEDFLQELEIITTQNLETATSFIGMEEIWLNKKANVEAWSALECVEHLNRYADFYLPEIEKALAKATPFNGKEFKSTWLGHYFAESMKPKESLNKMKTFASKNPIGSSLSKEVIYQFIQDQQKILEFLKESTNKNLDSATCKTTLPLLCFKLGDTLRFTIYHNQRHIFQALRAIKS